MSPSATGQQDGELASSSLSPRRALRIAGTSGSAADRRYALARLAKDDKLDVIIGDWLSEANMTIRGAEKVAGADAAFEPSFLEALVPAIPALSANKIKLICNAGASATQKLAETVKKLAPELKVAWVEGDECLDQIKARLQAGEDFKSLTEAKTLKDWRQPIYAQAYLGAYGIVTALEAGADIVIAGRVADASPCVAVCVWWHSWDCGNADALAHALICGHLIECSTYITGGNWSGFKALAGQWTDIAYPIAEVEADGTHVITMEEGHHGVVNKSTCSAQLVYEIQGPLYYNSDVVAELTNIKMEEVGKNRVRVSGVKGLPPPSTTKVGITALGGYQAEMQYFLVGLDIKEKAQQIEDQCRAHLDEASFSLLQFTVSGTPAVDPESQDEATVELRVFAQAETEAALSPLKFAKVISDQIMQVGPGATLGLDMRKGLPKPFYDYFVTTLPQSDLKHIAHLPDGSVVDIPAPTKSSEFQSVQDSDETRDPVPLDTFGPTQRVALGTIVHGRSGDKGTDANVGFFVRHSDEWDWLRSLLTVDKVKQLLGRDYKGERVDRFELPNLFAVHFLLKNHLGGVSSTSTYDYLGKNVAEYLRCKFVDVPVKFLERGKL